jgi:hypothetical protein
MSSASSNSGDVLGPIPGLRGGASGGGAGGWLARLRAGPSIGDSFGAAGAWWNRRTSGPGGRRFKRIVLASALMVLVGGGAGAYFALRPVPKPDYMTAGLDDVFSFTLLTDEFNKLPIQERLALMGMLIKRMQSMSAGDSMLLAAFASGIGGAAREQIEKNASKLAIDAWDMYAVKYADVPAEQRAEFLEDVFIEFTKTMEVAVDGKPQDLTDEQRLSGMERQVERDREQLRDADRQPTGQELGQFFSFVSTNVGGRANAQQRARGQQMLRDMTRHFRGQDISTGAPKAAPKKGPG